MGELEGSEGACVAHVALQTTGNVLDMNTSRVGDASCGSLVSTRGAPSFGNDTW